MGVIIQEDIFLGATLNFYEVLNGNYERKNTSIFIIFLSFPYRRGRVMKKFKKSLELPTLPLLSYAIKTRQTSGQNNNSETKRVEWMVIHILSSDRRPNRKGGLYIILTT